MPRKFGGNTQFFHYIYTIEIKLEIYSIVKVSRIYSTPKNGADRGRLRSGRTMRMPGPRHSGGLKKQRDINLKNPEFKNIILEFHWKFWASLEKPEYT